MSLPSTGRDPDQVLSLLGEYRKNDVNWKSGRTFGYCYVPGEEALETCRKAYGSFLYENALDPTAYPSLLRLENELVAIAASHLGGDEHTAGTFSSGGTESIFLAVKTCRDKARAERSDLGRAELVVPTTAHASFHKAAHYLDMKLVPVEVDPHSFKADPAAMAAAITDNTVLLVASAPSYAHGVIDPIEELGALALERGLPLHVDACIGGWLLPFLKRLGSNVPAFDLSVPGVTSISMDFHKYAYAAKGASVVLYRDKSWRFHQIYACSRWAGYTLINPTVQSSRSGGPLAGAWAVLHNLGDDGNLELARQIRDTTRSFARGVEAIPELRLMAEPQMSLFSFTSDTVSVFHIVDEMAERGWYVQPQLKFGASKENVHLSIHPGNVGLEGEFLVDLRDAVKAAKALPTGTLSGMAEQVTQAVRAGLSPEQLGMLMAMAGVQGNQVPGRMAPVNELLNELPADVSEVLLTAFVNELFVAAG